MKKILFLILFSFALLNFTIAAGENIYSVSDGLWVGSIWNQGNPSGAGSPIAGFLDTGDTIRINHTITVSSNFGYGSITGLVFILDDTLIFDGGRLTLASDAKIIFTENGFIQSTATGGASDQIRFGTGPSGATWKGNDTPEGSLSGPGTLDNSYTGSGALPIELKSFTAQVKNSTAQLDWVTAKEENFSHFEVERSTDMQNFTTIGLVQGQGESLSDVSYDFEDSNAPFGIIYYRLKAVDIDDTFDYSPVVQVENGFNGRISVYPNPAAQNENMKIKLPSAFEGNVNYIAIYDLQGSKMQEAYNYDPNTALNINKQVKAGLYLLKIQHNGVEENIRVMIK